MDDDPLQVLNLAASTLSSKRASLALKEEHDRLQRQNSVSRLIPHLDAMQKILSGRLKVKISVSATRLHLDVILKRPWSIVGQRAIKFRVYPTAGMNPDQLEALPLFERMAGNVDLPKFQAYMVEHNGSHQDRMIRDVSADGVIRYLLKQAAPLLQD